MNSTTKNVDLSGGRGGLIISTHNIAIWSIYVYIVCSVVFEFSAASITALASYSLYLCLGCCMLDCLRSKRIRFHWIVGSLFIFGILIWISCYYTPASPAYTGSRMYRYWTSLVLMFLIICVKPNSSDIGKLINAYIVAGVALAIYIYVFYGFDTLISSGTRLQNGDFGNVNVVGMHCAFSAILAVYAMIALKKKKIYCIIAFIICLPCIMFSGSRKALLTLIVCLFAFVILYSENIVLIKKIALGGGVLLGIIVIVNVVPAFKPIKERMLGLFNLLDGKEASVVGDASRMIYLKGGLHAFWESPIIGQGFGYSYYLFGAYSHNNYVEILMCHGIIGFLIYYYVFIKMLHTCRHSGTEHRLKVFVYIVLIKMLMEDIGTVTYYNRATFLIFAILASCIDSRIAQPQELRRSTC